MTEASETAGAGPEPALLLADGVGGFYAVPRSVAEGYRASDALMSEARRQLAEAQATGEVTGYAAGMGNAFFAPVHAGLFLPGLTPGNPCPRGQRLANLRDFQLCVPDYREQ
ncbi:MAG TPA: hypothetical protein VIU62_21805 [Chloroflexota bacterium]|jgi:hypothetical protein